jgi:hypothetical protein
MPIYLVARNNGSGPAENRLVKARSSAEALRLVAWDLFSVNSLGAEEVAALMSQGLKLEVAIESPSGKPRYIPLQLGAETPQDEAGVATEAVTLLAPDAERGGGA